MHPANYWQRCWLGGLAALTLGAGTILWSFAEVTAQAPASSPRPLRWDYQSVGVEFSGLPARLTDLGNDGWEVVIVLNTDSTVENNAENRPHLLTQRVEIVAKRLRP
jgi:hypothetical protein